MSIVAHNPKKHRDMAMQKAYAFARMGDFYNSQAWIDRAGHFFIVGPQQLAYANKLLAEARKENQS